MARNERERSLKAKGEYGEGLEACEVRDEGYRNEYEADCCSALDPGSWLPSLAVAVTTTDKGTKGQGEPRGRPAESGTRSPGAPQHRLPGGPITFPYLAKPVTCQDQHSISRISG